jgi:hypothetical protein
MESGGTNIPEHHENEFMKRGYLLPDGCKDLTDAMKLQQPLPLKSLPLISSQAVEALKQWKSMGTVPPNIQGVVMIPGQITVLKLAAAVGKKPSYIMAELMKMGYLAAPEHQLSFETAATLARKCGFLAKRATE